jgi:hypothetical protein
MPLESLYYLDVYVTGRQCTCLGHLGHHDTDRIISICVLLDRVAKASTVVSLLLAFSSYTLCKWSYGLSLILKKGPSCKTVKGKSSKTLNINHYGDFNNN